MKFVELKKHITTQKHFYCYNLVGDDNFLIDSAIDMFFNYVAQNEFNKCIVGNEDLSEAKLTNALNSASFLGGTKVVLVKYFDLVKNKNVVGYVENYLIKNPNEFAVLVITSESPIFTEKQTNLLKDKCVVVDCNRLDNQMLLVWINSTLKNCGASMQESAKLKLIDFTNGYLSKISMELNKLINFAGGREITINDVEKLVVRDLEFSVFELTENLGRGNTEKTFEILDLMMADKKSAPSVFAMIQNYFRRMFFATISKGTNAQIAEELGVKEFAVKKAKEVAQLFSKANLKTINDLCVELDFKIKTSQVNYQSAVNYLVLQILTINKK